MKKVRQPKPAAPDDAKSKLIGSKNQGLEQNVTDMLAVKPAGKNRKRPQKRSR
jgi:hypothetical protein